MPTNLPFLREFLIDGCLAEAGVLDPVVLDAALRPEALIANLDSPGLFTAVAVEAWVRHWQRQVPDLAGAPRRQP